MKLCKRCDTDKPDKDFYFDKTKDRLYAYCKPCHKSIAAGWAKKNKRKVAADARKRYRESPEKHRTATAKWRKDHREAEKKRARDRFRNLHAVCIEGLGAACACCGEPRRTMLEIDHIGGGGNEHRRRSGGSVGTYNEIILSGFPRNRFQVLCANCNQSKRRNIGVCEHASERYKTSAIGFLAPSQIGDDE